MTDLLKETEGQVLNVESFTMSDIYKSKLNSEGEKTRVEKIEMFDEFEEWELLQGHYCLTLSVLMQSDKSVLNTLAIW